MSERLHAIVDRISRLGERISSRIEKFSNKGIDTAKAEVFLAESKIKTKQANFKIDKTKQAIITAIESENPKEAFKNIRSLIEDTINTIRDSHKSIVDSVKELRFTIEKRSVSSTNTTLPSKTTDASTTNQTKK